MTTQVSANISNEGNANMEELCEIPEEFIIPSQLVLSRESFNKILDMIENPPEPSQALIDLIMNRKDD